MDETFKTMAEVDRGGCYVQLPDGTIVRDAAEPATAAATAEGGPGSAVGTATGNGASPATPEDATTTAPARKARGTTKAD